MHSKMVSAQKQNPPPVEVRRARFLYQKTADEIRRQIVEGIHDPTSRLPSQVEFSKELGVSQITVRRAIQELIDEGILFANRGDGTYVNQENITIRSSEPKNIAWVFQEVLGGYHFLKPLAAPIRQQCEQIGCNLQFLEISGDLCDPDEFLNLLPHNVAGMIVVSPIRAHLLSILQQQKIPYIVLYYELSDRQSHCISVNYVTAAVLVAQHLLEQGCRRLTWITAGQNRYSTRQLRLGFDLAVSLMEDVGDQIQIDVVHGDYSNRHCFNIVDHWLKENKLPEGLFFTSETMATATAFALQQAGVRVPDDVAIVSFGNSKTSLSSNITSIENHKEKTGQIAMKVLSQLIQGHEPDNRHILIEPELIIRESSLRSRKNKL